MLYPAKFLYMNDDLIASTDPEWLQGALKTLTRFFYRVRLQTDVRKTVGILCRPCCAVGNHSQ